MNLPKSVVAKLATWSQVELVWNRPEVVEMYKRSQCIYAFFCLIEGWLTFVLLPGSGLGSFSLSFLSPQCFSVRLHNMPLNYQYNISGRNICIVRIHNKPPKNVQRFSFLYDFPNIFCLKPCLLPGLVYFQDKF